MKHANTPCRKHVRAFRARKAVEVAQIKWRMSPEALLADGPVQPPDWKRHEYEHQLGAEYITEVAERPESRPVERAPRKFWSSFEILLGERHARPLHWQIDEDELGSACSTEIVERPESRAVVHTSVRKSSSICSLQKSCKTPNTCTRQAVSVTPTTIGHSVRPQDMPVDYTASLMNGLFEDFLARANFDHKDKPRVQAMNYSRLVNPHPTLALCAVMVGWSRGDNSLIRLASESYHHALRFVRLYTADAHLKSAALALVIAVMDLCNYEVCRAILSGRCTLTS